MQRLDDQRAEVHGVLVLVLAGGRFGRLVQCAGDDGQHVLTGLLDEVDAPALCTAQRLGGVSGHQVGKAEHRAERILQLMAHVCKKSHLGAGVRGDAGPAQAGRRRPCRGGGADE